MILFLGVNYALNHRFTHKIGGFCGDFTDFSEKVPDHPERRKKGQKRPAERCIIDLFAYRVSRRMGVSGERLFDFGANNPLTQLFKNKRTRLPERQVGLRDLAKTKDPFRRPHRWCIAAICGTDCPTIWRFSHLGAHARTANESERRGGDNRGRVIGVKGMQGGEREKGRGKKGGDFGIFGRGSFEVHSEKIAVSGGYGIMWFGRGAGL